jgi:hypothetical protein
MKKLLLITLVIAGLMLVQMALAKGPPAKVTISGGDLTEEIEIVDDEATLTALGTMYLEDYDTRSRQAPEEISGDGYLITRYFVDDMADEDEFFPFDQVRFYAHPDGYSAGYIQYIGMINGSSEYDGLWFRASREGQAALENVIAAAEADASSASASQRIGIFELFFSAIAQFMSAY